MHTSNGFRRLLAVTGVLVVLGAAALSAAGCSTTTSAAPSTEPVAQVGSPNGGAAQQAAPAAVHGTGLGASTSATVASAPTAADGKAVVQASCLGQCHGNNLLNYRTSAATAQKVAASMGAKANVSADQQKAIAIFFAQ